MSVCLFNLTVESFKSDYGVVQNQLLNLQMTQGTVDPLLDSVFTHLLHLGV